MDLTNVRHISKASVTVATLSDPLLCNNKVMTFNDSVSLTEMIRKRIFKDDATKTFTRIALPSLHPVTVDEVVDNFHTSLIPML